MKTVQKCFCTALFLTGTLLFPLLLAAQSSGEDDSGVILDPGADPYYYYDDSYPQYSLESGLFAGRSHLGFEMTLLQADSDMYGSFFGGIAGGRNAESLFDGAWVAGISAGQQFYLSERLNGLEGNRTELYFRFGPGVGLAGRGTFLGSDSVYHFGLNVNAILGAQFRISDNTSFFMHGGGRVLWYPSLQEIDLIGIPMVAAGFRYSITNTISPVRFRTR